MSAALAFSPAPQSPARRPIARRSEHLRVCGPGDMPAAPVAFVDRRDVRILHRPSAAESVAPLRLTRRGVVVLSLAVAALGMALFWIAARTAAADGAAPTGAATTQRTVVVRSGDTLWSIANRVAPQVDPRAEVDLLARLNHVVDADLQPGQILRLH